MTVNTSGKWWIGDRPEDIGTFLEAYATEGYEIKQFRLSKCECGSLEFTLEADDNEGVARRTCTSCLRQHFICDSSEYWGEAGAEKWTCVECQSQRANVGVGFSIYEDDPTGVKWLYVGERCAECGVMGCFAGWKVALSDELYLLDQA